MLTPQLIEKMNLLKAALDGNPEFMQNLKNSSNKPRGETEHPLLTFAQQNGIDINAEELHTFFEAMQSNNQELNDALLEMIAGGQSSWSDLNWGGFLFNPGYIPPGTDPRTI